MHASSEVAEIGEAVRAGRAGAVAPSGFHCRHARPPLKKARAKGG
ncbi:hypothetical protein HMPREF1980_01873 [Actinomyces sp. oral taxon 172 str. F0311]|nr:hypothetical protein HMPREF1980_01873 [Actinomyces sp. oral taxon 172 str. F0311]